MIDKTINNVGLQFIGTINGRPFHFQEWNATDDCIYYMPLSMLVDNGSAIYEGNVCEVPFASLYLLEECDRNILGIPTQYPYGMRLRSDGMLNETTFKYFIDFVIEGSTGKILSTQRYGNILITENKQYLLSQTQYELCKLVDEFNLTDNSSKNFQSNLLAFAKIKVIANMCNCELDSYLTGENVYSPREIKIELGRENDEFTLKPSIDIQENEKFQRTFERQRRTLDNYPVQDEDGNRTRIVLTKSQQEGLKTLKDRGTRFASREEIQQILAMPTEFFDPDVFDLSDFYSDRVLEIGIYKPKFYAFVCPYKSNWTAGATVESPSEGTAKISVKSEEELNELSSAIDETESKNKFIVDYCGCSLDIQDAKYLLELAKKQLESPKKPIEEQGGKKVLIIEENAETLGFVVKTPIIEHGDRYTLFINPRLASPYTLKSHQEEGVAWLQHLYKSNAPGCLMADDMGLGKTLQILYFIDWHSQKWTDHKPYLIVAPVSLLENWRNEFERFFPTSNLKISLKTSRHVPRQFDKSIVEDLQRQDIVLTNYESLRNSQLNFCAVDFDVIVLDEAQKIKSPGTMITNAAKALKGKFRIAMTGTPVENTLVDLWCIMDFCVPGLLGNARAFAAKYQSPLKSRDTDIIALGNEIHETLGIYLIRRMKNEVATDLPQKYEIKKQIAMPAIQEATYVSAVNRYNSGIQPNMLVTIMEIREISEHPYLYDHSIHSRTEKELIQDSARVRATIEFLDDIYAKNEKAIIFVERKESQRMLQILLNSLYGITAKIINGDTPTMPQFRSGKLSRQHAIDEFQAKVGFNVIIMSPIAAGMGLNVTGANHVIHFSRHWNPAKENQATDRAYRIGQDKDVYVYYPMSVIPGVSSFDLSLDELLSRKTALASSTIFPTERVEVKQEELAELLFQNR